LHGLHGVRGYGNSTKPNPQPIPRCVLQHEGLLQEGHVVLQEEGSRLLQGRQLLLQG
jgi:hypothetical protein